MPRCAYRSRSAPVGTALRVRCHDRNRHASPAPVCAAHAPTETTFARSGLQRETARDRRRSPRCRPSTSPGDRGSVCPARSEHVDAPWSTASFPGSSSGARSHPQRQVQHGHPPPHPVRPRVGVVSTLEGRRETPRSRSDNALRPDDNQDMDSDRQSRGSRTVWIWRRPGAVHERTGPHVAAPPADRSARASVAADPMRSPGPASRKRW